MWTFCLAHLLAVLQMWQERMFFPKKSVQNNVSCIHSNYVTKWSFLMDELTPKKHTIDTLPDCKQQYFVSFFPSVTVCCRSNTGSSLIN